MAVIVFDTCQVSKMAVFSPRATLRGVWGSQRHDDSVINIGWTCGFNLASMCLCVTLAVVLTLVISAKVHAQNESVDKEAILKPCFIPEKNLTMAVGMTIPDDGHHCRMKKCVSSKSTDSTNKMHFTIVTCPDVFYNGRNPTCKITEGNSDLPYPECCRRIDCSLEMQDEEDEEDYDDPTTTTTPKPTTRRPRRRSGGKEGVFSVPRRRGAEPRASKGPTPSGGPSASFHPLGGRDFALKTTHTPSTGLNSRDLTTP
uniref:(California timema) hypothetical protein n=1 Tax=Timema californicum TaxID=61474 RepID=A0A7R9J6H5_TIMCA|nr:unnamed protein product [Timema californicum]